MAANTKAAIDRFANIASISVTESAANTLTFKKLETGIATFDKLAWLISRIEYYPNSVAAGTFNGDSDSLTLAITVANNLATLAGSDISTNPSVLHGMTLQRCDYGTAASGSITIRPFVYDFSNLPGMGLIVPPTAIYLAACGSGLASATTNWARIYYTVLQLTTEDFWELVESRRIIQS